MQIFSKKSNFVDAQVEEKKDVVETLTDAELGI
jgi:hypothetical protein